MSPLGFQKYSAAPATFQRAMDNLIGNMKILCVLVYFYEITVFSCNFQEHLGHLRLVLNRLQEAILNLKPSRCSFFKKEMVFLGHHVLQPGIVPLLEKFMLSGI